LWLERGKSVETAQRRLKRLKVSNFPQAGEYVPSVRVAGKWLKECDFTVGDEVVLTATSGKIVITKRNKEGGD
jgi:hypothetical protein